MIDRSASMLTLCASAEAVSALQADTVVLTQLTHLRFRVIQPVRHTHFALHRHCDCEVLLSLSVIAPAVMQFAESEGAMARPHAAGLSLSPVSRAEGVHVRNLAPACGVRVGVRGICDQSIAA
jgi:hypothetical protein